MTVSEVAFDTQTSARIAALRRGSGVGLAGVDRHIEHARPTARHRWRNMKRLKPSLLDRHDRLDAGTTCDELALLTLSWCDTSSLVRIESSSNTLRTLLSTDEARLHVWSRLSDALALTR